MHLLELNKVPWWTFWKGTAPVTAFSDSDRFCFNSLKLHFVSTLRFHIKDISSKMCANILIEHMFRQWGKIATIYIYWYEKYICLPQRRLFVEIHFYKWNGDICVHQSWLFNSIAVCEWVHQSFFTISPSLPNPTVCLILSGGQCSLLFERGTAVGSRKKHWMSRILPLEEQGSGMKNTAIKLLNLQYYHTICISILCCL